MQQRSVTTINNEKINESNISESDNSNTKKNNTNKIINIHHNNSSKNNNENNTVISHSKNLSNIPLIDKTATEINFKNLNQNNNSILNYSKISNDGNNKEIELIGIKKNNSFNYYSPEIRKHFLLRNKNSTAMKTKTILKNNGSDEKEKKNNNNKNISNQTNELQSINDLNSNFITNHNNEKQNEINFKNNRTYDKLLENNFYQDIFLSKFADKLKDLNEFILEDSNGNRNKKNYHDFNLNFAFNHLNYGNISNEFEIKILEEKITPRTIRGGNTTNRDFKDSDNLLVMQKRFREEREIHDKKNIEEKIEKLKSEKEKLLSKKLLGFSEQKIKQKLRLLDFFILLFVISDVCIAVYTNHRFTSNEYDRNQRLIKEKFKIDNDINNLRIVMIIIVFLIDIFLILKYHFKLKQYRMKNLASYKDGIFTSGLYKKFFIEIFILSIFTPPQTNDLIKGDLNFGRFTYSLDSIILLFKLMKLYYLLHVISNISVWVSDSTKEIARSLKAVVGFNFAFKAGIKYRPTIIILCSFLLMLIVSGFVIKVFEYGFSRDLETLRVYKNVTSRVYDENKFFESYWDVFWLIIITMMTVGYGEIFPQTHIGRLICFVISLFGMIMVSLIIVRLGNLVELGIDEKKALHAIKVNQNLNEIEIQAKILIKALFKLKLITLKKKEYFENSNKLSIFFIELFNAKEKIKDFYNIMKKHDADSIYLEDIIAHFSRKVESDTNQIGFLKYVGEDMFDLVNEINKSHLEIHKSLDLLKAKQNNISRFMVNLNNRLLEEKGDNIDITKFNNAEMI